jgi:addiction module HigA family antidote
MPQQHLATHLGCDVKVVNRIVNGRMSVSAEMALKLAATFRTSPEMWLNAQKAIDLYEALRHLRRLPKPLLQVRPRSCSSPRPASFATRRSADVPSRTVSW